MGTENSIFGGCRKRRRVEKNIEIIKLDILDYMDCEKAWSYEIDILVSNAGMEHLGPVSEMPVGLIREVMETNVFFKSRICTTFHQTNGGER